MVWWRPGRTSVPQQRFDTNRPIIARGPVGRERVTDADGSVRTQHPLRSRGPPKANLHTHARRLACFRSVSKSDLDAKNRNSEPPHKWTMIRIRMRVDFIDQRRD